MKRVAVIFVIGLFWIGLCADLFADRRGFVNTIVIDPGHGGREPGAVGRRAVEKDIALAISLKLGAYIRENIRDVEVIYTRETDVFVPLHERARIANENNADLFISIHCNSSTNRSATGTETFVMGLHRSEANLEVARRENKSILYEDDYLETYDGFDPNSPEANIIFALYQNAYLEQSLRMASFVQYQFRERARRKDRGVKQAGFLVLYNVTMPGILVEAGFISNQREEEYLMSETGQAHIASAIFRAFREYKDEQDAMAAARTQYVAHITNHQQTKPETPRNASIETPRNTSEETPRNASIETPRNTSEETPRNTSEETPRNASIETPLKTPEETPRNASEETPRNASEETPLKTPEETHQPYGANSPINGISAADKTEKPADVSANESEILNISFRVQFATSTDERSPDDPVFGGLENVMCYFHEGLYKYTVGNKSTFEAAAGLQKQLQDAGFTDAFVVAFLNEERISASTAIRLLQNKNN